MIMIPIMHIIFVLVLPLELLAVLSLSFSAGRARTCALKASIKLHTEINNLNCVKPSMK